ncbi:MAG: SMC-Scp complex subunit ScpB [Methylococcales bacterium]|nr:SMC-Scp complex subunit ScpB [Methylococcales bacterium]
MTLESILEALLFAADQPLSAERLQALFPELEQPSVAEIDQALQQLMAFYQPRALQLKRVASGYRFQVKADYATWLSRLFAEKPPKYSKAVLETLAIIAYRQPVTRGDIEDIRGVAVSSTIIKTLLERDWIKSVGHKDAPGKPALYATTKHFLDYFNLQSLAELPALLQPAEPDDSVLAANFDNSREQDQKTIESAQEQTDNRNENTAIAHSDR